MQNYDFNQLEARARSLRESGDYEFAIAIYMSDGDASLNAGYLGMQIGLCYEQLNRFHEAKYWFGRAIEETRNCRNISLRESVLNTQILVGSSSKKII